MHWTKIDKSRKWNSTKEFDELFNSPSESEVVISYLINNNYYAAVKNLSNNKISAVVCLLKINKDKTVSYNVMYEDQNPPVYEAPIDLINKLSPTTNNLANIWRTNCKNNQNSKIK